MRAAVEIGIQPGQDDQVVEALKSQILDQVIGVNPAMGTMQLIMKVQKDVFTAKQELQKLLVSKSMDIKQIGQIMQGIANDLDGMMLRLGDEITLLREKVEAINEEFLAPIFRGVLKADLDSRESKYKKYFDRRFDELENMQSTLQEQLLQAQTKKEEQQPAFNARQRRKAEKAEKKKLDREEKKAFKKLAASVQVEESKEQKPKGASRKPDVQECYFDEVMEQYEALQKCQVTKSQTMDSRFKREEQIIPPDFDAYAVAKFGISKRVQDDFYQLMSISGPGRLILKSRFTSKDSRADVAKAITARVIEVLERGPVILTIGCSPNMAFLVIIFKDFDIQKIVKLEEKVLPNSASSLVLRVDKRNNLISELYRGLSIAFSPTHLKIRSLEYKGVPGVDHSFRLYLPLTFETDIYQIV